MARRRYQGGCVYRRGGQWIGRWREDVINEKGELERPLRYETWQVSEYPTKRLVQRELQRKLAEVNARSYRAKPQTHFEVFAEKWKASVLPNLKPSTQSAIKSQLRKWLVPSFGHLPLTHLTGEVLQRFVSTAATSPKTVRNLVSTLRIMWNTARAWKLVEGNPFEDLRLPVRQKPQPRFFTADEMRRIIEAAPEPYKTFFWLAAETGMRAGELCGLTWEDINENECCVRVRQAVWRGRCQTPKTGTAVRTFAISARLHEHLRGIFCATTRPDVRFLFHTSTGSALDGNLIVKRKLRPILEAIGIERCGLHAFRHGNATLLDQANVPMKVRQARLGHADSEMTAHYTHVISLDDRNAAQAVEKALFDTKPLESRGFVQGITWQIAGGNA